jgi:hypothetical protein
MQRLNIMKINKAHIGMQVVYSEAFDATVYEIMALRRSGTGVIATLQDIDSESKEIEMEVSYLSLPTIGQLTQKV